MNLPRLGRYELVDKLGEGAMGVVYRARDPTLGRVVALKALSADLLADEELHQRFLREAEAVGRLNHTNIVTVYDRGEERGQVFMVMELLDGDDLRALIDRTNDVPLADKVRILVQICEGLHYAHSRGVVHRDVKPANIIVTASGVVKLLDFGLARVATRETITRRGVILGTPDYMSPEQAMGKELDHRTDIFSAGAVFYEFLTGHKPFQGKTLHSVLYQIVSEEPEPVLTINPELPGRLAFLVHRMLRKAPDGRYSSFDETARELQMIHAALRRTKSRSAFPLAASTPGTSSTLDDVRNRVRELVARGQTEYAAGRISKARALMVEALALEPGSDEAAEILWRCSKQIQGTRPPAPMRGPETEARIKALLERAAPGRPDAEAQKALAELALVAPDDPRLQEVLRERSGRDRER
jgi:eukaryotic-like serine/threonine-protein kinase